MVKTFPVSFLYNSMVRFGILAIYFAIGVNSVASGAMRFKNCGWWSPRSAKSCKLLIGVCANVSYGRAQLGRASVVRVLHVV